MDKQTSKEKVICAVFLLLTFAGSLRSSVTILQTLPTKISFFANNPGLIDKIPALKESFIKIPLEAISAVLIIIVMPVAGVFLLKSRNWARIVMTRLFLFLLFDAVIHFVLYYPFLAKQTAAIHSEFEVSTMRQYFGPDFAWNIQLEMLYLQVSLIQVLWLILPIYHLTLTKVKEQYR